ncbi:MAG TPA: M20 family metallo-hydrolase [Acidobacteriaceae bacterium]|nr:M20 family metallo-hydrolase [Acidobacteriaceae bacterium]
MSVEVSNAIAIDAARLLAELKTLSRITDCEQDPAKPEDVAVTRVVFSENDMKARAWLKGLAKDAGLKVREDAVGNTFIRLEGSHPELPAVGTGSHTDAIPFAGMYDGTVGVLGGLEALRAIKAGGLRPKRSVELLMFTSEEPTRFGIGCIGSRLLAGTIDPVKADALEDKDEKTMAERRAASGFTGTLASVKLPKDYYSAWVELHIEQGPLLEREGIQIGIVTDIAAPSGYKFLIEGFGGHAGALLMPDRKDALCAASEIILSLEKNVLATGSINTVGTIGLCRVHPGAVNSVPSRVLLEADVRDTDPARREGVMQRVRAEIEAIAARRGVKITETKVNADDPAQSSAHIVDVVEAICKAEKLSYKKMVSRAYHDSLFMARIAPIAMIFIPCRNGVSHKPDEYSTPEQIAMGTRVLAQALAQLANE